MENFTEIFNTFLALGTIFLQILTVFIIFLIFFFKKTKILDFLSEKTNLFVFLLSLFSMIFSLIYSEIIGFSACILCIIQRWFLYPQVLIYGFGFLKNSYWVYVSGFLLSVFGGIVSLYHNWIDLGGKSLGICNTETAVSCTQRFVYEFGYITIPMMTLTVFVAIIVLLINKNIKEKTKKNPYE